MLKLLFAVDLQDFGNDFATRQCQQVWFRLAHPLSALPCPPFHWDKALGWTDPTSWQTKWNPTLITFSPQRRTRDKRRSTKTKNKTKEHLKWGLTSFKILPDIFYWEKANEGSTMVSGIGQTWWLLVLWSRDDNLIFSSFTLLIP